MLLVLIMTSSTQVLIRLVPMMVSGVARLGYSLETLEALII